MSGGRASNIVRKADGSSGCGKGGQRYRKNRVMPVEGRALTLDGLLKKERTGDPQRAWKHRFRSGPLRESSIGRRSKPDFRWNAALQLILCWCQLKTNPK
jgi:hypothetical protein